MKTLIATAALALTLTAPLLADTPSQPATHGLIANGWSLNGLKLNGWQLNGFRMNGFRFNGRMFNGKLFNGMGQTDVSPFVGMDAVPLGE